MLKNVKPEAGRMFALAGRAGLAKPPFVATCSLWRSQQDLQSYAYGAGTSHSTAIAADQVNPFHHQSAFIRFDVDSHHGELTGRNPLRQGLPLVEVR